MESIENFFKKSSLTILNAAALFCSVICPSVAFIFLFKRDLLTHLDNIKLIIVCIAFSAPIWVVNFFLVTSKYQAKVKAKNELQPKSRMHNMVLITSILSFGVFYLPAFVKIFYNNLTAGQGLNIAIGLELIIVLLLVKEKNQ